jgi:RimJ/RimL family protein N-acetyltransferase
VVESLQDCQLCTPRLRLRRPAESDAASIIAVAGDWEVARRLARIPHPYTREHFRFFMDSVVAAEPTWAIVWRRTAQLIGVIGLHPNDSGQSAEVGYYIARPFWGQGFATEAAQVIVRTGFEVFRYVKLTSGYQADNLASGRVLEKLGFEPCGRSTRHCLADGTAKPSIEVELFRRALLGQAGKGLAG